MVEFLVQHERNYYIASIKNPHIWGTGNTPQEAVDDALDSMRELIEIFNTTPIDNWAPGSRERAEVEILAFKKILRDNHTFKIQADDEVN